MNSMKAMQVAKQMKTLSSLKKIFLPLTMKY